MRDGWVEVMLDEGRSEHRINTSQLNADNFTDSEGKTLTIVLGGVIRKVLL